MKFVSLKQASKALSVIGATNTVLFEGQPGIGKSSLLKQFSTDQFIHAYIDCGNLDLGDLGFPVVCRDVMETRYAPNARFRISEAFSCGKPIVVMLDELGKASKPVLNMLLPIILERRLGDIVLPHDSVVFATTNLSTDGVGDNIPAHAYNRMTTIKIFGPSMQDWQEWAFDNDIDPVLIAWAQENPEAFDTYAHPLTGVDPKDNHLNFNPTKAGQNKFFCSPRSLAHASPIIAQRAELGSEIMEAALAGTVGGAAAASLRTFIDFADQLPPFSAILADPEKTKLPSGVGYFVCAVMLAARVDGSNYQPVMQYVKRFDADEAKAMFCQLAMRKPNAISFLIKSREYAEMSAKVMAQVHVG